MVFLGKSWWTPYEAAEDHNYIGCEGGCKFCPPPPSTPCSRTVHCVLWEKHVWEAACIISRTMLLYVFLCYWYVFDKSWRTPYDTTKGHNFIGCEGGGVILYPPLHPGDRNILRVLCTEYCVLWEEKAWETVCVISRMMFLWQILMDHLRGSQGS